MGAHTTTQRIEFHEAENAFAEVEPLIQVARCGCGRDLRFFRRTWQMLVNRSQKRETRAPCGPSGHVVVLDGQAVVRIECPNGE